MFADMSIPNEAWAAINSVAVAITAIFAFVAKMNSDKNHAASAAAIQAVHANDVNPTDQNKAIAQAAISVLPAQPVILPPSPAVLTNPQTGVQGATTPQINETNQRST